MHMYTQDTQYSNTVEFLKCIFYIQILDSVITGIDIVAHTYMGNDNWALKKARYVHTKTTYVVSVHMC